MTWKSAMDLVDIDKVLDNLELNEEQNKEEVPAIKQMQILNSSGLPSHIASGSLNETPQNTSFGQTTPNSICDQVNRFVGMSQVFSSLDVYRKNVEFLNTSECNNNTNNKFEHLENTKTDTKADSEQTHSICEEEVEEDPCTDDEINKFVSADEYGQSSNSITTSSSSTFSSGPSPALISTESDNSFDVKQEVKGLPKEHDKQSAAFDKIDNTKSSSNQDELNKDLHERSEYDDLAVGLSSISLTQHGSSLSSEISSSKCISKSDILSSILSLSETAEISEELPSKPKDSLEVANPHKPKSNLKNSESDIEEKNNSAHHATVTFGWTVDEISDTELESILQEIDMEMSSDLPEHVRNLTQEQSSAGSDELKALVEKDKLENLSSSDHKKKANSEMGASSWMGEVWRNSDSSSQASTIEFAEVRAHEDETDCYKNGNKICDVDGEELNDAKQGVSLKRQRPTTLDLPVKKINLYATAGQTPPGLQIHDQLTSSSEEDTPEFKAGLVKSPINVYFNDDAGHTPPELSDKSDFGADETKTEVETTSNYDETMLNPEGMPSNLDIETTAAESTYVNTLSSVGETTNNLGKVPPIWVPDQEANACMQCQQKFTLLKRRHHCRACGQVLCSVCCSQKFKLEFLSNLESRVCVQCFLILSKLQQQTEQQSSSYESVTSYPALRTPNPNNPMEYCSKIPPYRQVNSQPMSYPSVIVPVGVLKKEGNATKSRKRKSVMFSDGIRPGSDLASLDRKWSDAKHARKSTPSNSFASETAGCTPRSSNSQFFSRNDTKSLVGDSTSCFKLTDDKTLPPIVVSKNSEILYEEVENNAELIKRLQTESVKFLINANFYVHVRIVHLKCCINKTVINFTTCGLYNVGNDEVIILLELDDSNEVPKDIFVYLNEIYWEASKGHPITELTFSMPKDVNFLGSREHGGFLFIRSTFQCLIDVHVPNTPFLIGLLIHRWEVPWAKIFPLRLMLRLGAQYRYYPSPHISVREREPVYADIAQTIINLLADFRNYTYTLPTIKGLYIHMEERKTNILIPRNRHDDVIKAIKNSSDHILALGANFSKKADGHLVCIQNLKSESSDSNSYSTQAINIQGQPRKVTGASFFVLNEALKSTSGLSGKCSIIEDGLMVQILPSKMIDVRNALMNMKDIDIVCGPIEAGEQQTEVVYIQWVDDDTEINKGVISPVDSRKMDGIPSIRVHSGVSLSNTYHILKWTEVFLIEVGSKQPSCKGAVDVSKVSEKIAKNASVALLPFLELLVANGSNTIGLRVNLNSDSVSYEAGSQNEKLPPLYMNALDNELIPTLHKLASEIGNVLVLELIFHILKENINLSKM